MTTVVRRRRDADLPALVTLLAEQQPFTEYPLRWPLPFPVEQFLVRETEEAAWVVEVDGQVMGHVSVAGPGPELAAPLTALAGTDRIAMISVLVVRLGAGGRGLGTRLLDTAVAWIRESARLPVLDVVATHDRAVGLYRARGWQEVGHLRPGWLPQDRPALLVMALPTSTRRPGVRPDMSEQPNLQGPASYVPSIGKKDGHPVVAHTLAEK